MKPLLIILALIILAALLYKRDVFWDMFPHEVTEQPLQDTTVR
jgi:fumarate reductase subunit C